MSAELADTLAKSGESVKAGPIGLAVILLLCIACYFLFKSMSKHMREVREHFPSDGPSSSSSSSSSSDDATADATADPAADGTAESPVAEPAAPSAKRDQAPDPPAE